MAYSNDPRPAAETLPTRYDLPSEAPEDPGLPDECHDFQPQLLRETCQPPSYPTQEIFVGPDLNLYYDVRHTRWHQRPDWFLVLGLPRALQQTDLRWSYVIWQEGVSPFLVIELLSPGTEAEDTEGTWLRWYQDEDRWVPIAEERAEQEYQRAEPLAAQLRALGMEPEWEGVMTSLIQPFSSAIAAATRALGSLPVVSPVPVL